MLWPERRRLIALALAWTALMVGFDQLRAQPWVYQYAMMLAIIASHNPLFGAARNRKADDNLALADRSARYSLTTLRLVVVCIYLYSALHKMSWSFISVTGPEMLKPLLDLLGAQPFQVYLAALLPLGELGVALALIFPKTRRLGVAGAVSMHCCILALLGPWLHNYNVVVWPWNGVMIALNLLLFWEQSAPRPDRGTPNPVQPVGRSVPPPHRGLPRFARWGAILLAGIVPVGGLFDRVDLYFSWGLYVGRPPKALVVMEREMIDRLPRPIRQRVRSFEWGLGIELHRWPLDELNVAYPALWFFERGARVLAPFVRSPEDAKLTLISRPPLWQTEGWRVEKPLGSAR